MPEPSQEVVVDGANLTVDDVATVARDRTPARFDEDARRRVAEARDHVEDLLASDDPVYGVNTGFGALARVRIPPEDQEPLQDHLIRSHACGSGDPLDEEVVRAMLLLQANGLAHGTSGVRPLVVDHVLTLLNESVHPVVPSQGSLGSSGDLIPLAHVALVLMGEGEATVDGDRVPGDEALEHAGLDALNLQAKEGLALINGTQLMTSLLALAVHDGWNLVRNAEVTGAMSLEVLQGSIAPLDPRLHEARPHPGQGESATNLRSLTEGSPLVASHADCDRVQDAYTLRCMPQVLGAARTALHHAQDVVERELNSATDNPLILPGGDAVSGGNFHGQPLANVAGYLATALHEVADMSERRTNRLLDSDHNQGLPPFLTRHEGVNSGFMIPQYLAAGLVMENRVLVHPAAADSIPVSADQEDHNSNGALACRNLRTVLTNSEKVVAVELLCACQALDLSGPDAAPATHAAHDAVREVSDPLTEDRSLHPDIEAVHKLLHGGAVVAAAQEVTGPLR